MVQTKVATKERLLGKFYALAALVGVVVVNAAANLIPLNGNTTAQVSDAYPNLFAPAPYTFAIWGVIYAFLAGFAVYQFNAIRLRKKRSLLSEDLIRHLGTGFLLTSALNMAWMFAWQYRHIGTALVLMIALLVVLMHNLRVLQGVKRSRWDTVFVAAPFSLYAGWITVATIANAVTWLVSAHWNGWGITGWLWTALVVVVGAVVVVSVGMRLRNPVYIAVGIWAYVGLYVRHITTFQMQYPVVVIVLIASISAMSYAVLRALPARVQARLRLR